MTKKELIEEIKVLNHNLSCKEWEVDILQKRLKKVVDHLEKEGMSIKEINKLLKI